jgi:uncharacterized membrane protein HdeD (DUF308 family)
MHVTPISFESLGRKPIHAAARRLSRNWTTVLLNGTALILAGVLIFSIEWSVDSLAVFIGALFVLEGIGAIATTGIDNRDYNAVIGLLSAAAGIAMITWPSPSLTVVGIFLGGWLTVVGTLTISGAFAGRRVLPDWWLLLLIGLVEVPLGVLALAEPGATLAGLVIVGGIWAVAIGVARVVLAFELRGLPDKVRAPYTEHAVNGARGPSQPDFYAHEREAVPR